MKPAPFTYHRPATLGDAVKLLAEFAPHEGRVLAGGQSLVPIMAFRLARPAHLIDINAIAALDRLAVLDDKLCIGAGVRHGNFHRAVGHGPLGPDGSPAGPFGKVPSEVSLEAAQQSARLTALAVIAGLTRAIGDLDRIAGWTMVNGFVNADPGYAQTTLVLNPFSDLILDVFGADVGAHARTAIGVAAVPLNLPLVVSAEIELLPVPG